MSEATRETIRQLAEVTERYAGTSEPASYAGVSEPASGPVTPTPAATSPAIATPDLARSSRQAERDEAAMEAMARVKDRAMAQHVTSRMVSVQYGPMETIAPDYVADHKCKSLKLPHVGAAQSDGTRLYQQDVAVADWHHRSDAFKVGAVCDGHGPEVAGELMPWHVLERHLIATLRAHLPRPDAVADLTPHRVRKALIRAISGSRARPSPPHSVVEQMSQCNAVDNGSTLVAAVQIKNLVYVLNVGDSRAVLVRRDGTAHQVSVDHKTYEPEEKKLVQRRVDAGEASVEPAFPHRMLRHGRDGNVYGIGMSRSIGDDQATMSTPEISMFKLHPDHVALVLCSDGIFDTMHNDQLGLYVSAVMSHARTNIATLAQRAAEGLVGWCYDTEMYDPQGDVDIDNMTALVLPLQEE